ncbi:MAG: ferrous iron transport protein B [Tissierellia bacterium]|nr:ferrous iron transport protein B [Tissierellia bacterium]
MKIALVGNPNSGKTTLFNALTGSAQHVGNWPGVTVEKKEGKLKKHKDIDIVDLPGIYSLSPYTLEEVITRDYIIDEKPELIINIVDASNLERNLYLSTQVLEMGTPVIIALNMMDVVKKSGDTIDMDKLSIALQVPIVPISAVREEGINELVKISLDYIEKNSELQPQVMFDEEVETVLDSIMLKLDDSLGVQKRYFAIKIFERDEKVLEKLNYTISPEVEKMIADFEEREDDDSESIITTERYGFIIRKLQGIHTKKHQSEMTTSDKIDKVITNKYLALPIFFLIMWGIYYLAVTLGQETQDITEGLIGNLGGAVGAFLENAGAGEMAVSIVVDGIINSIGSIFIYVPQLMILFFLLSILEDSGYMARVAFIMDRIFRKFGLSGKSFIPMLIGTGCSIPGIMASRTIENRRDRDMTILLTPFIPCSAKMPVFGMFIAMMFSDATWIGPTIYIIAIGMIIVSGIVLKKTKRFKGDPAPFVMELPTYKVPRLKGLIIHMWEKAKSFIKKAGTIIFVTVLAIWVLQNFDFQFNYLAGENIDDSMLASVGNAVRWIFVPLGFGDSWAAPAATLAGMLAKEVSVATFASIGQVMPIEFSQVSAFSFMIFTVFAAPCFAAIGAMKREYGNWRDLGFALAFQTGLAYVFAFLVNTIGNLVFKGTSIVQKVPLDYTIMEEVSESVDISLGGNVVVYAFLGIIVASMIYMLFYSIRQKAKQN